MKVPAVLLGFIALLLPSLAPADTPDSVQALDDVLVIGKPVYLYESDRQLARLRASLPGLETERPAVEGAISRALKLLFADPNELRPDQQAMLLRTTGETGPDNLP